MDLRAEICNSFVWNADCDKIQSIEVLIKFDYQRSIVRITEIDIWISNTENRFLKIDYRKSISDTRLPKIDFWKSISDTRIPKIDFWKSISDTRLPKIEYRYSISRYRSLLFEQSISDNRILSILRCFEFCRNRRSIQDLFFGLVFFRQSNSAVPVV